ncbi:glycosyltransferase [Pseudomonas sp. NIBRBAC000502773]|uniref:glycosyltransferase n=1 Tax=Pseudomonas sp. NIBRBAC000502773 TaxID=2590776 RepID=UPI001130D5BC|nr:glycosyltransferase [Pseudomonas sp. NIBRBAC000502773]QDG59410.1 glycosyltransferase [Pseudomonas sp. NIBRBAC000502773]
MRVLIGPVEIAGVAKGLAKGFAENGISADLVLESRHIFSYGGARDSWLIRAWQAIGARRGATQSRQLLRKIFYVLLHKAWSWLVFLGSVFCYDAYIFLYGRTLTDSHLELFLLKAFRKKVVFINVGSDFRPPYLDGSVYPCVAESPDFHKLGRVVNTLKKRIALHERYADFIVSSPSSSHFHEQPFINWFAMGVPAAFDAPVGIDTKPAAGKVTILHSPSSPLAKGSQRIGEVIDGLIARGYPIEFIKLQGVSNQEVLKQLAHCDFIVDQLYSDIPLAVFGSEAARFGKPCVIAGYMAENVSRYIQAEDVPPSLYVLPQNLEAAIEKLVCEPEYRTELGRRAQLFVQERWSCAVVARRYLDLLEGTPRAEWWFDPSRIDYVGGCCAPDYHVRFLVSGVVEQLGASALAMGDKPALERALLDLVKSEDQVSNA